MQGENRVKEVWAVIQPERLLLNGLSSRTTRKRSEGSADVFLRCSEITVNS